MAAARDRDMEDAPFLLAVLRQAVRHHPVGHPEHGDSIPFPTLDAVDRRERHAGGIGLALEGGAQPVLERGRVGVEVGDSEQALEVVEVARPLTAARAVEHAHRRSEADVVAHDLEDLAGRTVATGVDDEPEVVGEREHLGGVLVADLTGQPRDRGGGPRGAAGEALGEPLRQAASGPAQDLDDVALAEAAGTRGDAQVRQRGTQPRACQDVGGEDGGDGDLGRVQGDMRREEQRVDAREHGDGRGLDAGFGEPRLHHIDGRHRTGVGCVLDDAEGAAGRVAAGTGHDLLVDAPLVVAEQRRRGCNHLDRAAVVHVQGVLAGTGEQGGVVDEEAGVGVGVAIDALVVVADAEHVEAGQRQQAQQQDVGRGEVLELVDEHVAAGALQLAAERAVAEQRLDRGVDLLVEVDGAALGQGGAVGGEQRGEAGHVVAPGLHLVGIVQAEADRRQAFEIGADRVGVGAPLATARQQRVDEASDVALVEHRGGPAAVPCDHPQPERVERADRQGGAVGDVACAAFHLELRLLVVGDGQHAGGLEAPVLDEVTQPFGEHARLAGAGGGDDPRRAGAVADGGELVVGERGVRRPARGDERGRAELDRLGVDDQLAVLARTARAAVDPHRATVGEADVAVRAERGRDRRGTLDDARGLGRPPPHEHAGAGVVVVRPDEEVQAVEPRLGERRVRPRLAGDRLGRSEARRVDAERDDDRPARDQAANSRATTPAGASSAGSSIATTSAPDPPVRNGSAGEHDDAAPESGAGTVAATCAP